MKKIIAYLFIWVFCILNLNLIWWNVYAQKSGQTSSQEDGQTNTCSGIKLNTNFPIIWNCIEIDKDWENPTNVFPYMIWALTKIIMSLILVVCFILIIYSGILWASSWDNNSRATEAKWILKKVAIVILLLWFSWAILRLINPNFFS